jgi:radical SAM superfamily enzyme YgiQ (UPF0313 family)
LEQNKFVIDVVDCLTYNLNYESFREEIGKRKPDIVGVTCNTLTYKSALQILKVTKEALPNCITIIGGHHVTFEDEQAFKDLPTLDAVIRNEGEYTMLELAQRVEQGKDWHDVIGTTTQKDGKIVRNPKRAYIENLDELPFPARHLWPLEATSKYGKIMFDIIASRGCSYWCDFCIEVRMHGQKFRKRSVQNVCDELEECKKTFGATWFSFVDAAFTVDQKFTADLCDEIIKRNLNVNWVAGTRVDMVTKELLQKMAQAGCKSMWYGVESGAQNVLNEMRKGITLEQTVKAFQWTVEAGMKPDPNVVLGFPGETKESAWATIKLCQKIAPTYMASYTIATPYPGTPLYYLVKEKGWLKDTNFDHYDTATPTFETPTMTIQELRKLRAKAWSSFYERPSYIRAMFKKGVIYGLAAMKAAVTYRIIDLRIALQPNRVPPKPPSKSHF